MRASLPKMRSLVAALLAAPLITPVLAVPLLAVLMPGFYRSFDDLAGMSLTVAVFAWVFGYAGMTVVVLPVYFVLRHRRRLDALAFCLWTTLIGATLFALAVDDLRSLLSPVLLAKWVLGAACSLGVSAFFCALAGIQMRANRISPEWQESTPPQ